jgi:hypothetical protein
MKLLHVGESPFLAFWYLFAFGASIILVLHVICAGIAARYKRRIQQLLLANGIRED